MERPCIVCKGTRFVMSRGAEQVSYPIPCECAELNPLRQQFNEKTAVLIANTLPEKQGLAWQLCFDLLEMFSGVEDKYLKTQRHLEPAEVIQEVAA